MKKGEIFLGKNKRHYKILSIRKNKVKLQSKEFQVPFTLDKNELEKYFETVNQEKK